MLSGCGFFVEAYRFPSPKSFHTTGKLVYMELMYRSLHRLSNLIESYWPSAK